MTTSFNAEQLISANSAAVAHFQSVATTALSAVESLAALNLGFARESLENASKHSHAALSVKTPQEVAELQSKAVQPAAENIVTYSRSVYEISTGAAKEIADLLKGQFDEMNKVAQESAAQFAKSSPFGSDIILAAVKQSVDAGNTAYASFDKASKKAADIAKANIDKISTAAVKVAKAK
jgi:phasin family protein